MRRALFRISALALVSVLLPAWSCGERLNSAGSLNPPADLLSHAGEPEMTAAALNSEQAYEDQRNAKIEWGRGNASALDRACWWFQDAGVHGLSCPTRPKP